MNRRLGDGKCSQYAADRNRLAELLTEAAEFEHDVLCQYLFAAFSMKKRGDRHVTLRQLEMMRMWEAHLLKIARQEMEHLALVNNLLTAIGEAPYFRRHNYPVAAQHYPPDVPSRLERFSLDSLRRFVLFEMPEQLDDQNVAYIKKHMDMPDFKPTAYRSVAFLYNEIQSLLDHIDPDCLFIGPPSSQFTTSEIIPIPVRGLYLVGNITQAPKPYDVSLIPVTDKASADQAIAQIIAEGEGTDDDDPNSHFAMFLQMHQQYKAELKKQPNFDPARPVVTNPTYDTTIRRADDKHTIITNKDTIGVSKLFDQVYATMLQMLMRYFSHADESLAELAGLQQAVFFPLMTAVVRPLGEILTQLPVSSHPSEGTAGPTFLFGRQLELLPHRDTAWQVLYLQLAEMAARANDLRRSDAYADPIRERLTLIYENLARIEMNFGSAMKLGSEA